MNTDPYRSCTLCPRDCGVNRLAGGKGRCGETASCRIASFGPHFGEEPPISGTRGSGTIFFSGCSSGCFFCQNRQISLDKVGYVVTPEELLDVARTLIGRDVHNLNFVTPDHFWPHIAWVCGQLREHGVTIPFLFNSSGYQRADRLDEYSTWMDIFMPDFKFADPALARLCMGDERYPEIALEALRRMVEARGFLDPFDLSGQNAALRGVLVRHLVLPGHVENTLNVLRILRREFGKFLPLSIMSQYRPMAECISRNLLTRTVTAIEYSRVLDEARDLGFENVFAQHVHDETEFLPDFQRREPFEGNRRRGTGIRGLGD